MDPLTNCAAAIHQDQQVRTLYWRDRNLRFHECDRIAPSASIADVLAEIDRDPTGVFWG